MNDEPKPAPSPLDQVSIRDPELEAHEVPEVIEFLRSNATSIIIAVGVAAVVFVSVSAYHNYRKSAAITAQSMLFNSRTAEQFQDLVAKYGATPAAPMAEIALASTYFDQGQYDLARHVYAEFSTKHPDHELRPAADLGLAHCLEASGQLEQALAAFSAFAKTHADHYLIAPALFGEARCLEQLGRFDEAKAVYEDYITAHPGTDWAGRAESALMYVAKARRAAQTTTAAPAAPVVFMPPPQVEAAPAPTAP